MGQLAAIALEDALGVKLLNRGYRSIGFVAAVGRRLSRAAEPYSAPLFATRS